MIRHLWMGLFVDNLRTPLITLMVRLIGSKSLVMVLQGEEERLIFRYASRNQES